MLFAFIVYKYSCSPCCCGGSCVLADGVALGVVLHVVLVGQEDEWI